MRLTRSVLCAGIVGLTACGGSQATTEPVPPPPAAEPQPAEPATRAAATPATSLAVSASELSWQAVPDGDGLEIAIVHQDPASEAMAFFVKAPAGWSQPSHYHPTDFHRLVVEGDMIVTLPDGQAIAAETGDYLRGRANTVHSSSTENGFTLFIVSDSAFSSILLDADGKPVKAGEPAPGEPGGEAVQVTADARPWSDVPGQEGLQVAPVYRDPDTGAMAVFIRADGGFQTPPHTHTSDYHRLVLEGSLTVTPTGGEGQTSGPGDYARGREAAPHVSSTEAGGLLFVVSDGPWEQAPVAE